MAIHFACPNCGQPIDVADDQAGKACAACGGAAIAPGTIAGAPLAVKLGCLLMIGVAAISLLLPAQRACRPARRSQCSNNLKLIGLALQSYHNAYQSFPPAYIADANGKPMHSWRVLILPFLESKDLYARYNFNEPWDGPNNQQLASLMPPSYACPSGPNERASGITSYAVVVGPDTLFDGPDGHSFADIRDGSSRTIAVVEAGHAGLNWMEPKDLDLARMSFKINGDAGISSPHPAGAQAVMADGSVKVLSNDLPAQTLRALLTRSGGEPVPPGF